MKNTIRVIAIMFTLLVGGNAWAADIFTPALSTLNADSVNCRVLNTGTTTANDVTIDIRSIGNVSQASTTDDIPGGEAEAVAYDNPSFTVYCKVSGIAKGKARVALCIRDANATVIECVTGQ